MTRLSDRGLDLQAAMDEPRLFPLPGSNAIEVEQRLRPVVTEAFCRVRAGGPVTALAGRRRASQCDRLPGGVLVGGLDH